MKKLLFIVLFISAVAAASAGESETKVTVYSRGVAQVSQIVRYDLAKGENVITFAGLPEKILPESILLKPVKNDGKINIRQMDFLKEKLDLDRLYRECLNQVMNLTVKDSVVTGRLLNFDDSYLFLEADTGGIILVKRSQLEDLTFTRIPEEVVVSPSLRCLIDNGGKKGDADFALDYLTNGISWSAYYQAVYGEGKLSLQGSFILENNLDVGYDGVELALIAGDAHMAYDKEKLPRSGDEVLAGKPSLNEGEPFFAYYRYPVTMKTDIPPHSLKHLPLMESKSFPAKEKYMMKEGFGLRNLETVVVFSAPDTPLPEGEISVSLLDAKGKTIFAGEDHLYPAPAGSEIEIKVGENFNLQGERRRISHQRMNRDATEDEIQVKLINGSDKDAVVVVRERVFGVWEIVSAEFNGKAVNWKTIDAQKVEFEVLLPNDSTSVLVYKVKYEY